MNLRPSQQEKGILPMIVWDGLGLSAEHSGIGVYGRSLYAALNDLGCVPHVAAISGDMPAYVPEGYQIKIQSSDKRWVSMIQRLKPFYPLSTYNACKDTWLDSGLIFHALSNLNLPIVLSKRSSDRFVVTIHDIIPLNLEEITPLALQMMVVLPRVVARADKIITTSYWTKIQLLERFGADLSDKIINIGCGSQAPSTPGAEWLSRSIDGLSIARGESYKRTELIAEIAERLPDKKFALVTDALGIKRIKLRPKNLELLTNLSDSGLEELYANAKIFLHPSLYEGWCLPAADALARGLPLIYCRGSGIDEVAAFGKKFVKGLNREATVDDWVSAFQSLVTKEPPRGELPRLPSWLEIAQKTLKIYESLL